MPQGVAERDAADAGKGGKIVGMREIKFRAWDGKQMRVVRLERIRQAYDGDLSFTDGEIDHGEYHDLDHFPLMQFTGRQDSKGRDIYEGDIVVGKWKTPFMDDLEVKPSRVAWNDFGPGWMVHGYAGESFTRFRDLEVVGNIHETPELLKTELLQTASV
jgi:uncharacterized phage protein (TIGR01671 family)